MKKWILYVLLLLALPTLACGGQISQSDIEASATQAAQTAQTAATTAALLADQGQTIIATVQASDFDMPDIDTAALRERAQNLQPDENGNVTLTVTQDEVNQAIQDTQAEAETIRLENASFQFTDGQVILNGDITNPIEAPLQVTFSVAVTEGQLSFTLLNASIGDIPVPAAVLTTATSTLNSSIGDVANNLPDEYTLQRVSVTEGLISITASK